MKRLSSKYYIVTLILSFVFITMCSLLFAQDTTISTHTTSALTESPWYMQQWVWITGGIALLLILISLVSGGKKKVKPITHQEKIIITKTIRTETETDE